MSNPILALTYASLLLATSFVLFRPDEGLFWQWQRQRQLTHRVLSEDSLKHIYNNELINNVTTLDSVTGAIGISGNQAAILLHEMAKHGLLKLEGAEFKLT